MFPLGTGDADNAQSKSPGQWPTDRADDDALCRGRLYLAAPAHCQWALRNGTMDERYDPGDFERPAVIGAKQSGNLYADRDALIDCGDSNPGQCYLRRDDAQYRLSISF
jgi:hypothetical protein